MISPADVARFWTRTRKRGACLVWRGERQSQKRLPYGLFSYKGVDGRRRRVAAHKVAFLLTSDFLEIPAVLEVGHKCHNSLCVKPEHLELVTHVENVRESLTVGRRARKEGSTR